MRLHNLAFFALAALLVLVSNAGADELELLANKASTEELANKVLTTAQTVPSRCSKPGVPYASLADVVGDVKCDRDPTPCLTRYCNRTTSTSAGGSGGVHP